MLPGLGVRCLLLPKRGSSGVECEDACAANQRLLRFAIADGATEAFDSRRWARYLVRAWAHPSVTEPTEDDYLAGLRHMCDRFARRLQGSSLPWFVAAKAAEGSFATFLGIRLIPDGAGGGTWEALAVGDSCLFVFSAGVPQTSFPISDPAAFGSHPHAIPSRVTSELALVELVQRGAGHFGPGDRLLLATDAAAQWILRCRDTDETGALLSSRLAADDAGLKSLIEQARSDGGIRNDDVGLLFVDVPDCAGKPQELA